MTTPDPSLNANDARPGGVTGACPGNEADNTHGVAPTNSGRFNTLRPSLRPDACWRIDDHRFDFDSSFIRPTAAREFALLAQARPPEEGDGPAVGLLMTVFGHADPINSDEYNKVLSGRRALAVLGVLLRDTEIWEELYSKPYRGDKWGNLQVQEMLAALGYANSGSGYLDELTTAAVRQFQSDNGLPATGFPGQDTRKVMFALYMDFLCQRDGIPFRYRRQDFLSRGTTAEWHRDCQGCGEFNPVLVFSQAESAAYAKPGSEGARNKDNEPNRRVVVYMFRPELADLIQDWPCPTLAEKEAGTAKCKAQFWPDGDLRRSPQEKRREHSANGRTMACLFYDRFARGAPCEGVRRAARITLLNRDGKWAVNAPYRLRTDAEVRTGVTNAQGQLNEADLTGGALAIVEWGTPEGTTGYDNFAEFFLKPSQSGGLSERSERELYNLGYWEQEDPINRVKFGVEYATPDVSDSNVHETHAGGPEKVQRIV